MTLPIISKNSLNITSETELEIWSYCPAHNDTGRPNFYITKSDGFGYCFACGYKARIKDLGVIMKSSKKKKERKDWYSIWNKYYLRWQHDKVNKPNLLGAEFEVNPNTLENYGLGSTGTEYCYPMCNEDAQIIGIQRRYENGRKVNIKGSRLGLFLPMDFQDHRVIKRLFIMEGWSDTVTCADLMTDYESVVIGRPNAKAVRDMCVRFCDKWIDKSCLINILPDSDAVGGDGAIDLMKDLRKNGFKESQIWPIWGFKDFRCMTQEKGKDYSRKWLGI